jgi:hypothetical protein
MHGVGAAPTFGAATRVNINARKALQGLQERAENMSLEASSVGLLHAFRNELARGVLLSKVGILNVVFP